MLKPIILDVECIVCNKSLQKINHNPENTSRPQNMGKVPNSRRVRTPNWSLDEKQHLLELIKKRKEVVITKNNNGPNHSEEKDVAWNEILRELAVRFGSKFNASSIKKVKTQWQNMKRIAREEIALNGTALQNYSRQSLEVCDLLELTKDNVFKKEDETIKETTITTNIEIKTERIDEDVEQPSCSTIDNTSMATDNTKDDTEDPNLTAQCNLSVSSISEQTLEIMDEAEDNTCETEISCRSHVSAATMTDIPHAQESNLATHLRELQGFLQLGAAEKHLKIESLKDERQVMRIMRETAELNKILAEQRLKHLLWVKQQEMA